MALLGCETNPSIQQATETSKSEVVFVDFGKFDTELNASLNQIKGPVTVTFYDPVSPNKIPERLQKWLSSVEKSGGKVDINPPAGDMVAKNPAMFLGLFSGLWSGLKALAEIRNEQMFNATSSRNAVIELDRDASRNMIVKKLVFVAKPEKN